MTKRKGYWALGLCAGVCFAAAPVFTATAGDKDKDKHKEHEHYGEHEHEGMPDQEEAMQRMMELGTPGEEHAYLAKSVGKWELLIKHWMTPDAPVEESRFYSESEMIMGGRYLLEHVEGEFDMGDGNMMPFKGVALVGYDKGRGVFFSRWIDNMSTGFMDEEGKLNDKGQLVTKGKTFNPMFNRMMKTKSITTNIDDNTRTMEMWTQGEEGKMFKSMEITYTRQ